MKLLINISKPAYDTVIATKNIPNDFDAFENALVEAVESGIPIPDNATVCDIDAIRQEIEQKYNDYKMRDDYEEAYGLEEALMIIDRHMKGDSE